MAPACGSSNDTPATDTSTGGATAGGSAATGGAKATGGAPAAATGGAKATGGAPAAATGGAPAAATGGTPAAATGGAKATGGTSAAATGGAPTTTGGTSAVAGGTSAVAGASATGGTNAAGGTSTAGGVSGTGGSAAAITCPDDNLASDASFYQTTNFCTPANPDLSLITGTLTVGGVNINATGGTITMTGTPSATGPLTVARPFNQDPCKSAGLNATVTGSDAGLSYTGITFTVQNSQAASTTLTIYLPDRVTVSGTSYYVVGSAAITVAGNTTVTQTVKWNALTTNCSMGSAPNYDSTQILAIGFGFPTTAAINLTISAVTFSTT